MKTFTILLLLMVHLVAFSQISPKQTSQSLKNPQNPEFLKTNLKHMGSHVVSDKKIPDLRAPQNSKLNRLKTDALEKIKQKEKSQNERLLNIRSSLSDSLNQEVYILDSLHVYSYSSPADSLLFGKIFLVYDEAGNNISFYTSELDTTYK
jgi:Skp family chaperone for outer membrane proteins